MTTDRITCDRISVAATRGRAHHPDILVDVSAIFTGGEVALITGNTGAGKTTLLRVLACLQRPSAGQVLFGNDPVSRWTPAYRDRWRRRVGFVFQTGLFLEDLNTIENVLVPLVPRQMPATEMTLRCHEMLALTDLTAMARIPVNRLSTGERQRVSIARALASAPAVILADEPTAHQDDCQAERIMALLAENARARQAVVVMTAHDPRVAQHPAVTTAYRLDSGRLERQP
ncbi:MAG: ATP-binding cassette domain-containing protein [Pseudomonadota bacterium]